MAKNKEIFYKNFSGLIDYGKMYDFKNKEYCLYTENVYVLNQLLKMFEYKNLPETTPAYIIELLLMCNGKAYFTNKYNGEDFYVYRCSLGSEPDVYYMPKEVIITNPYQNYNANLDREKDGVLLKNDPLMVGVIPMLCKYNTSIVETNLTIDILTKLSRATALVSSPDDKTKKAAEKFINDLVSGTYGIIGDSAFLEGLKSQNFTGSSSTNLITQLIELSNYNESKRLNAFGLQSNFNMKRESINEAEAGLNEKSLLPYADILLQQRKENVEKINKMYGLNISVDFSSSWKIQHEESEIHAEDDKIIEQ